MRIVDWKGLALVIIVLLCVGAGEVRAQACIASTPAQPSLRNLYCAGVNFCANTPGGAGALRISSLGGKSCGACFTNANDVWTCPYAPPGQVCVAGSYTNAVGVRPITTCKAGYSEWAYGNHGTCIDNYSLAEDADAEANGKRIVRDTDTGNILRVEQNGLPIAQFGDYDEFGRAGWYDDGTGRVTVTWPAGGACLFSALTVSDWTSTFSWGDLDHVSSIGAPVGHRPAHYDFGYYSDGALMTASSYVALYGSTVLTARRYAEDGTQIAIKNTFLPPTAAATAPGTTAAVTPAPANPLLQPKVSVARVTPGGPLGVRLLGPLGMVFPSQWIAEQIGRFYMNVHAAAVNNDTTKERCDAKLIAENRACRKFWTDRGLDPYDLPTDDLKMMHITCQKSALSNHDKCMNGIEPPLLALPFSGDVGNQANIDCYKMHARDKNSCRVAAKIKYAATGGAFPTMYQTDLLGCIVSAQRRLEQCKAGVALSDLLLP